MIKNGKPQTKRCASCAGKESAKIRIHSGDKHWHWKGGRQITKLGYVEVKLLPDSPYYSMAGKDGYIYEHRLIMAQHLGRCLEKGEEVHHANGIKHDNRFENFELNSKSEHNRLYHSDMKRLLLRISELETKVRELSQ
ncbi:MAG: HNH endonuclease [Gammaproteobacteria bacterium]|nr:HNH endonuclease [Gammaproteobacteria bacterium]